MVSSLVMTQWLLSLLWGNWLLRRFRAATSTLGGRRFLMVLWPMCKTERHTGSLLFQSISRSIESRYKVERYGCCRTLYGITGPCICRKPCSKNAQLWSYPCCIHGSKSSSIIRNYQNSHNVFLLLGTCLLARLWVQVIYRAQRSCWTLRPWDGTVAEAGWAQARAKYNNLNVEKPNVYSMYLCHLMPLTANWGLSSFFFPPWLPGWRDGHRVWFVSKPLSKASRAFQIGCYHTTFCEEQSAFEFNTFKSYLLASRSWPIDAALSRIKTAHEALQRLGKFWSEKLRGAERNDVDKLQRVSKFASLLAWNFFRGRAGLAASQCRRRGYSILSLHTAMRKGSETTENREQCFIVRHL